MHTCITSPHAIASSPSTSQSHTTLPPLSPSQAGRLLAALVSSLEGASPSGGEDGGEEAGEEEFAGYSAAYARLHNSQK